MNPSGQKNITVLFHILMAMIVALFGIEYFMTDDASIYVNYYLIIQFFVFYLLARLLFMVSQKWMLLIVISFISFLCVKESFLGVTQLFGHRSSNHYLYALTGSFKNPGPYGGFLAICISLLSAFYLKTKDCPGNLIYIFFHWVSLIAAFIAFIILPSTQSRSAILALGCSMILLALGTNSIKIKLKPTLKKYGFWLFLGVMAMIIGAYLIKKPSADGRLFIDKICIKAMYENGWNGAELGHFGGAYGEAQANYFKKQIDEKGKDDLDWSAINEHDRMTADCPDNAFNEYLFIGVEAGPFAMLLFIGIIITAIVISFKKGTIWCYGLTAFAVFALFSYPLHVKQFQILLPILLAACVSDRKKNIQEQNDESKAILANCINGILGIAPILVMLVVLSTFFVLNLPKVRLYKQAEKSWKKAERWYQMEYYEYVVEDCDTLLPYMKHDYRFLFAYGQSLNKTGNYEKSDSILKIGTELSSDPMFWNVMGNNSLALGKYSEAEERYKRAFYMVPNRLYPLNLLAKLYNHEGDSVRFLKVCSKIEVFIPKIESSNTERLRKEINEIRLGYLLKHPFEHREINIHRTGSR